MLQLMYKATLLPSDLHNTPGVYRLLHQQGSELSKRGAGTDLPLNQGIYGWRQADRQKNCE